MHTPRLFGWRAFYFAVFIQHFYNAFHHLLSFLDMGQLTPTEHHGDLHFILMLEKADRFLDLKIDIVLARFWPHSNLF